MNIIPEYKYAHKSIVNNMDILINVNLNDGGQNNNLIINIILDNSISVIGECFLNLKNGIKNLISLIDKEFKINLYDNNKILYSSKNNIDIINFKINNIVCEGFNNYKKFLNLKNCILFTDEIINNDEIEVINENNCNNIEYLKKIFLNIKNNIGICKINLIPLNGNFIKNIYNFENIKNIFISNLKKQKDYNFVINMDLISFFSDEIDVLEVKLYINNSLNITKILKIKFLNNINYDVKNNNVLIQKLIIQGNLIEKKARLLYQNNEINKLKNVLEELKKLYFKFTNNDLIKKKYNNISELLEYVNEDIYSHNLKSIELNYDIKLNHFNLE